MQMHRPTILAFVFVPTAHAQFVGPDDGSSTSRSLGAVILCVAAITSRAGEIKITAAPQMASTRAVLRAARVDGSGTAIEQDVAVPGRITVPLGAGIREIRIIGDGLWTAPVYVANDAPAEVQVLPAVTLVATAKGAKALRVGFSSIDDGPSGESSCSSQGESWRCVVPAGRYDLRFAAPGFAPEFRFGVSVDANTKPFSLGLVPGASLSGRLEAARGVRIPPDGVTVVLSSPGGERGPWKESVRSGRRGFFQFKGVAPGDYTLRGEVKGLTTQIESVRVLSGAAAELRAPLLLDSPKRLTVTVMPRLDPSGHPWRVRLVLNNPRLRHSDVLGESPLGENGEWTHPRLVAGPYTVELLTAGGERWKSQDITIGAKDEAIAIGAFSSRVAGTIRLGDRPLQATLSFGDEWGPKVRSDADGRFTGEIPPVDHEEQVVFIEAESPRVRRTTRAKLEKGENGERRLDIRLPATTLMGRVLREDRTVEPHAFLTIRGFDPFVAEQARVDADGSFQLGGFEPGSYRVVADGPESKSPYVTVDLRRDEPAETELILRRVEPLRGRVTIGDAPVVAAAVYVFPRDTWTPSMPQIRTDENGYFETELPPDTTTIDDVIIHPAFDVAFGRTVVQPQKQLHIRAQQLGGTVTVASKSDGAVLLHAGAEIPAAWLANTAGGEIDSGRITIPRLMPGTYSACAGTSQCVSGDLPPHGTLTLSIP